MIVIISLYKPCYETLRTILNLRMYHAQDTALCTNTPLLNPLPISCHASSESCLLHCENIREMHFVIGALYPALAQLKTFVYALPHHETNQNIYSAYCIQNSSGNRLYLDMLHAWYEEERDVQDDGAYECVMAVQRFWSSHHAQVMLIPQKQEAHACKYEEKDPRNTNKIMVAFECLKSMPTQSTGKTCLNLVQRIHATLLCSFTQRKQLYNLLRSQELRYGHVPQAIHATINEIMHHTKEHSSVDEKHKAFALLVQSLKEQH